MKYLSYTLLAIFSLAFFSCVDDYELTQDEDTVKLLEKQTRVEEFAKSVACTDESEWDFAPIGVKACGGPKGYIAYNTTIDTVTFFRYLEDYNSFEEIYNEKWNITSTCEVPPTPIDVICEDGQPVLIYEE